MGQFSNIHQLGWRERNEKKKKMDGRVSLMRRSRRNHGRQWVTPSDVERPSMLHLCLPTNQSGTFLGREGKTLRQRFSSYYYFRSPDFSLYPSPSPPPHLLYLILRAQHAASFLRTFSLNSLQIANAKRAFLFLSTGLSLSLDESRKPTRRLINLIKIMARAWQILDIFIFIFIPFHFFPWPLFRWIRFRYRVKWGG
ncbi:hypothetical protein IE53DRAFT_277362 [Violaceomyces palustris]|uniref:Uncharacterized protein n=1 Tax=Violaceomyces palustris TaxID=1673888 RepID=A0ACD0NMJ0_9BASI|nr:hypothetical protein IE53DRAFT_277362 [Violaceomyces palustris]